MYHSMITTLAITSNGLYGGQKIEFAEPNFF